MPVNKTETAVGGVPLDIWNRLVTLAAQDDRSPSELFEELVRKEEQHREADRKAASECVRAQCENGDGKERRLMSGA